MCPSRVPLHGPLSAHPHLSFSFLSRLHCTAGVSSSQLLASPLPSQPQLFPFFNIRASVLVPRPALLITSSSAPSFPRIPGKHTSWHFRKVLGDVLPSQFHNTTRVSCAPGSVGADSLAQSGTCAVCAHASSYGLRVPTYLSVVKYGAVLSNFLSFKPGGASYTGFRVQFAWM